MAWTANIVGKNKTNGMFSVTVSYTDGIDTITEVMKSLNPTTDWVAHNIVGRLSQLNNIETFDVSLGTPPDPTPPATIDETEVLFLKRVKLLEIIKLLIDMGIVPIDHPKVTQITDWIKANIGTYFDSLGK